MSEKGLWENGLISIGKLSKITGVHVQSLRYYERMGILLPAYIDSGSKYRYYSFPQIKIVEAIQHCVELDIPLKDFSLFISGDQNQIDYEKMLAHGKRLAQQKIDAIRQKLYFLEETSEDMQHGKLCADDRFIVAHLPAKTYLTVPYDGTQTAPAFHAAVIELLTKIRANGWQTTYDSGLLSRFSKDRVEQFAYVDILNGGWQVWQEPNVMHLPEMDFICTLKQNGDLRTAPELFREQFARPYDKILMERELFTGKFQCTESPYEMRCSLENGD